jgi:hypothetical protein
MNKFVKPLFLIFFGCFTFSLILYLPIPYQVGLLFRYEFTSAVLITFLSFYLSALLPGYWGKLVHAGVFFAIWALPLAGLWGSGNSEPGLIAGLLPFSDASLYQNDALRLLSGNLFSVFSGRRPLFAGLLATVFQLTAYNLQLTQAVLVLTTTISCYLLVRRTMFQVGKLPGSFLGLVLFVYYRRFTGLILTEHLGITLGALGFMFLMMAAEKNNAKILFAGALLLTLGLNARAGTFFVLPVLLLWVWWSNRKKNLKQWLSPLAFLGLGIALGFGINLIFGSIIATKDSVPFSNFSYTFYGLAKGGNWTLISSEHPELSKMNNEEATHMVYALTLKSIREQPQIFVGSVLKAYQMFFDPSNKSCSYGFFTGGEVATFADNKSNGRIVYLMGRILLFLLGAIGIFSAYLKRETPFFSLVLFFYLGVLLSVPFLPPWDADRMRAYAVSMPLIIMVPVIGLEYLLEKVKIKFLLNKGNDLDVSQGLLFGWPLLIIVVCTLVPIVLLKINSNGNEKSQFPSVTCQPGEKSVNFIYHKGFSVRVWDKINNNQSFPDLAYSDYIRGVHNFDYSNVITELDALTPPVMILKTMDEKNFSPLWVIMNPDITPEDGRLVSGCAYYPQNEEGKNALLTHVYKLEK